LDKIDWFYSVYKLNLFQKDIKKYYYCESCLTIKNIT
jgi:hypothetical protein